MYGYCAENFPEERKPNDTEEQFIYKARKKSLGVFKKELWELPEETRAEVRGALREQFEFLFRKLAVENTRDAVERHVRAAAVPRSGPSAMRHKAAADDWDLSD
jgi:fructose-bisphosphate aldolase, class II